MEPGWAGSPPSAPFQRLLPPTGPKGQQLPPPTPCRPSAAISCFTDIQEALRGRREAAKRSLPLPANASHPQQSDVSWAFRGSGGQEQGCAQGKGWNGSRTGAEPGVEHCPHPTLGLWKVGVCAAMHAPSRGGSGVLQRDSVGSSSHSVSPGKCLQPLPCIYCLSPWCCLVECETTLTTVC